MKKLVLIRHSHTNVSTERKSVFWSLSDEGVSLANTLSTHPDVQDIDVVYSSDQLKALHTAIIVASALGVPCQQRPDLTELTSMTVGWHEDFLQFVDDIYSGRVERHLDGESLAEALERFNAAIADIAVAETETETVGVVAHGNVLSLFAAQYEDRSPLEIHNCITMPDIAVLDWESKTFTRTFGNYDQ